MRLLGLGGDPFPRDKRDLVDRLSAEFTGLHEANQTRLRRYAEYRKENEASRAIDAPSRARGGDYGRETRVEEMERHHIALPFGQALTVKHSHRSVSRMPDSIVDRRQESPEETYRSNTMEKIWWAVARESGGAETLLGSGGWDGSQLGAACYDLYFDIGKQLPIIRSVDPSGVLVVKGVDDPHDFQRVYRFWQVNVEEAKATYRNHEFAGAPIPVDRLDDCTKSGDGDLITLVQMSDKERSIRFALGANAGDSLPLDETVHNLGFVNYVVIPNIGPYRDVWGWADYEFVRGLAHYLTALFSREADVLRMVANGAYLDKGTGQDAAIIEQVLAKGGVLPAKRESELDPVEAPQMPQFAGDHRETAIQFLKMLGFAPDAAWGEGGAGSGSDRGLQLQPMLELTAMKQTNWGRGLSRLGEMVFRMIEKMQVDKATFRGTRPGTTKGQYTAFEPFELGPRMSPLRGIMETQDDLGESVEVPVDLPRTPKELFGGDYAIRFLWQNRIDPDDPAFVLAELSKFTAGLQSAETTLDRLGFQSPEDELKRLEQEADRFPWLRDGKIEQIKSMLREMQGDTGGTGGTGGRPVDQSGRVMGALGMTGTKDGGALDADAAAAASGSPGPYSGGA